MWVSYTDNQCEQKQLHARRSAGAGESKEIDMELIGKQIAIETILGQPPELHYPSWYAAQIEKLPPAPPEYLAEQAGILVTDSDTISRAKAIEALDKRFDSIPMEQTSEILMLRKDLRDLPPAQPERIKGHWVNGRCDKCNEHAPFWAMASTYHESNFCPNCGADMRQREE